jgi:two-component system chemotaxis response regulator CheB
MTRRTRVLVVDDSAFARKVMRHVIGGAADFEVAGHARDGLEALEQIDALSPDVITLDLMMPQLDGLGVLRALAQREDAPRVVVVSSSAADSAIAIEALQLGAVEIVHKPTAIATDRLYDIADDLVAKLRIAARSRAPGALPELDLVAALPAGAPAPPATAHGTRVIVIGTSTGGPQALTHIASRLPGDLPVPVAAVVHIPVGYTASLAARLDRISTLTVVEAEEGLVVAAGMMVIARAGVHLALEASGEGARCRLMTEPRTSLHRPSVDALFTSAAEAFGPGVLAAVCTGMGEDGLLGARAIRDRGGRVLAESAWSCVVDGMPRSIREAGLADGEAPIEAMAAAFVARL